MMIYNGKKHRLSSLVALLLVMAISPGAVALEGSKTDQTLPVPLTLADAISIGSLSSHPDLLLSRANQISALSELEHARSGYELNASLDMSTALIEPSRLATDQSSDDHRATLNIRKQLYDFGYTSSAISSAEDAVVASEFRESHIRRLRQIEIVKAYYDVVLADLKYLWDNEAMSMRFVRLDKSRDRFALKQISDIELLKDEVGYQQALTKRRATDFLQRTARSILAESINRPGELSTHLDTRIRLKNDLALGEPEQYIMSALDKNAEILEQKKVLSAAEHSVASAKNRWHPTLEAEINVSEYSRELASSDNWRAGLNLHVPLSESTSSASEVTKKRSEQLYQLARLKQMELQARNRVYTLWQNIQTLQIEESQLKVEDKQAQRALDKIRGEYELEIKTNLGSALVNTSRIRYQLSKNKVEQVLAWMQLTMLVGHDPISVLDLNGRQ